MEISNCRPQEVEKKLPAGYLFCRLRYNCRYSCLEDGQLWYLDRALMTHI